MTNTIIGLDCGASHSSMVIWDSTGKISERHDLPGANLDLINTLETKTLFLQELEKISQYRDAYWVVGMAGLDSGAEVYEADKWFRDILETALPYSGLEVMSDIELVIWAGSPTGVGIGLIAGTGSNCLGRNSLGTSKKVGGMSHILSDEGGGFSMGWRGLHLITKMADGREEKTSLLREVLSLYNVEDVIALKNFLVSTFQMKVQVSRSAPLLLDASTRGERGAGKIVAEESLELIRMIAVVNETLGPEILPVYLGGSLFDDRDYRDMLAVNLKRYFPQQKVFHVRPIEGALNYAKKNLK